MARDPIVGHSLGVVLRSTDRYLQSLRSRELRMVRFHNCNGVAIDVFFAKPSGHLLHVKFIRPVDMTTWKT